MFSYISFYNNSSYPYISVYEDSEMLVEELTKNTKTKFYIKDAGSVSVTVSDNKKISFLDLYISLYPNEFYTLEITDTSAKFI